MPIVGNHLRVFHEHFRLSSGIVQGIRIQHKLYQASNKIIQASMED